MGFHNRAYQSHHTGIETKIPLSTHLAWETTNRTTLELKHVFNQFLIAAFVATNRTTLELKPVIGKPKRVALTSTNRTTLELKHSIGCTYWYVYYYQSHHTGIETKFLNMQNKPS